MRPDASGCPATHDDGFTLVEVIFALVIIGLIASSTAVFIARGVSSTATVTRAADAATVARLALDQVRAYNGTQEPTTGLSSLTKGRSRTASVNAWTAANADFGIDLSKTYTGAGSSEYDEQAYDNTPTASSVPNVPITTTRSMNDVTYEVTTLVGICTRKRDGNECNKDSSDTDDRLYRVVALVTWQPGASEQCEHAKCHTVATTLVNPLRQTTFPDSRRPVAVPDPADGGVIDVPIPGTGEDPAILSVLNNDGGYLGATTPLTILEPTNRNSVAVVDGNAVRVDPRGNGCGAETFKYRFTDAQGFQSNTVQVKYRTVPSAQDDDIQATSAEFELDLRTNDGLCRDFDGIVTIADVSNSSALQVTKVSGERVRVKILQNAGEHWFTYTVKSGGITSNTARVDIEFSGALRSGTPA